MLSQLIFLLVLSAAVAAFVWQFRRVMANIRLGRPDDRNDQPAARFKLMLLVAFGQKKMFKRWLPAVLHGILYVSFLVINIEVLEIVIDGLSGAHRILGQFAGPFYGALMYVNEFLGALVILASALLLIRRNVLKVKRFQGPEMTDSKGAVTLKNYSHLDANIILVTEIVLMAGLFLFNSADIRLHQMGHGALSPGELPGVYPISSLLASWGFPGSEVGALHFWERFGWWSHIVGIFLFLNYLPISKHFHIIMAFPNVYFSRLTPAGAFSSPKHIQEEVKAAFDYNYTPQLEPDGPKRFGARDVTDLSWKSLMDAYACTECGRCTAVCPANLTGKKLSPRKIVMNVRDRLEEVQKFKLAPDENGVLFPANGVAGAEEAAGHFLLSDHYITPEELRACTTCNACVEACPVNIDQVSIITDLRRYLVMEDSAMPQEWSLMIQNMENSGNPWAMPAASRGDWMS